MCEQCFVQAENYSKSVETTQQRKRLKGIYLTISSNMLSLFSLKSVRGKEKEPIF